MSKLKVFVVGDNWAIKRWLTKNNCEVVDDPFKAELLQFTGGEDVSPEIYGEENTHSHNNILRDMEEMAYFALARRLEIPMVGICRGAQFLNVMCGGSMVQDVKGHTRNHPIYVDVDTQSDFGEIEATSTHHQMMVPADWASVLAYADVTDVDDPEIVFYQEDATCLCFQPHPEYGNHPELEKLYFELINNYLVRKG